MKWRWNERTKNQKTAVAATRKWNIVLLVRRNKAKNFTCQNRVILITWRKYEVLWNRVILEPDKHKKKEHDYLKNVSKAKKE